MTNKLRKLFSVAFLSFTQCALFAQEKVSALEGTYFDSGKMWVVVTVGAVILAGIFVYLFMLGKKVKSLEEELKNK